MPENKANNGWGVTLKLKIMKFWNNVVWFFTEIMNIYSDKPSFFSKKRIESSIAFIIAEWGMIYFLVKNIEGLSASDMGIWATIQFLAAGYTVTQIQKEKRNRTPDDIDDVG